MIRIDLRVVWLFGFFVQSFGQALAMPMSVAEQFACYASGRTVHLNQCQRLLTATHDANVSLLQFIQPIPTESLEFDSIVDMNALPLYQRLENINSLVMPYFAAFYGPGHRPHVMNTYAFSRQLILNKLANMWQFCEPGRNCLYKYVSILDQGIGLGTTALDATMCQLDATRCAKTGQSQSTPLPTDQSACLFTDQKSINQCLLRQLEHKVPPCAQGKVLAPSAIQANTKLYSLLSFANVLMGSCANDYSPFTTFSLRTANVPAGTLMDMSNPCTLPWAVTGQGCSFAFASLHQAEKTRAWNGMHGLLGGNGLLLSLRDALQRDAKSSLVKTSDKQAIVCLIDAAETIYSTVANTCTKAYGCRPYANSSSLNGDDYSATVSDLLQLTGSPSCRSVLTSGESATASLNARLANGAAGKDLGAGVVSALASILDAVNTNALNIMDQNWRGDFSENACPLASDWLSMPAEVSSMAYLQATPTIMTLTASKAESTASNSFSPRALQNVVTHLSKTTSREVLQAMQDTPLYKIKYDFIIDLLQLSSSPFFPVWELLIQQSTTPLAIEATCENATGTFRAEVNPSDQMIFVRNGRIMQYVNTRTCMGEGLADSFGLARPIAFKLPSVLPKAQAMQHVWSGFVTQMVAQKIRLWSLKAIYKSVYSDALARQAIRRNAPLCSGDSCQPFAYSDIQRGMVQWALGETSLSGGLLVGAQTAVIKLARMYFHMYEQYEQSELDLLVHLLMYSDQTIEGIGVRHEMLDTAKAAMQSVYTGVDAP